MNTTCDKRQYKTEYDISAHGGGGGSRDYGGSWHCCGGNDDGGRCAPPPCSARAPSHPTHPAHPAHPIRSFSLCLLQTPAAVRRDVEPARRPQSSWSSHGCASDHASRLSCVAASQQPRHRHARCSPAGRPSAPRVPTLGDGRDAVAARRSKTGEAHLSSSSAAAS